MKSVRPVATLVQKHVIDPCESNAPSKMGAGLGQDTLSTPGASSKAARPCSGSATQMPVARPLARIGGKGCPAGPGRGVPAGIGGSGAALQGALAQPSSVDQITCARFNRFSTTDARASPGSPPPPPSRSPPSRYPRAGTSHRNSRRRSGRAEPAGRTVARNRGQPWVSAHLEV